MILSEFIFSKKNFLEKMHLFQLIAHILEDFENALPYFCTFFENSYCGYESVVNLTALSRDAADDLTWVHTVSSTFLNSQLKLFDYIVFKLSRV